MGLTVINEEKNLKSLILDLCIFSSSHSSAFAVWDARTMLELPIFESPLPQRVPYGVHGIWFQSLPS